MRTTGLAVMRTGAAVDLPDTEPRGGGPGPASPCASRFVVASASMSRALRGPAAAKQNRGIFLV